MPLRATMRRNRYVCIAGSALQKISNVRNGYLRQLIVVDTVRDTPATLKSVADTPGPEHLFCYVLWSAVHVVLHLHGIVSQVTFHF